MFAAPPRCGLRRVRSRGAVGGGGEGMGKGWGAYSNGVGSVALVAGWPFADDFTVGVAGGREVC